MDNFNLCFYIYVSHLILRQSDSLAFSSSLKNLFYMAVLHTTVSKRSGILYWLSIYAELALSVPVRFRIP